LYWRSDRAVNAAPDARKKAATVKIDLENGSQIQNNQGTDTGRHLWQSGENRVRIGRLIPVAHA
jgi:hypothetical protein